MTSELEPINSYKSLLDKLDIDIKNFDGMHERSDHEFISIEVQKFTDRIIFRSPIKVIKYFHLRWGEVD